MAFLTTTSACCAPIMAASAPRRRRSSLTVVRAAAKSAEHHEPAASLQANNGGGRRRAMMLLAATVTASSSAVVVGRPGPGNAAAGQWEEVNVADAYVKGLGEWAISEHNAQTGDTLLFGEVVNAQKQVVAGTNYMLQIKTKETGRHYKVGVFDPLPYSPDKRELKSFTPLRA